MSAPRDDSSPANLSGAPVTFGPFAPPDDYEFESELRGPAPRPRAAELNQGRYAQRTRRMLVGGLVAGVLCVVLGLLPVVQFVGQFLLPLAYLSWIGTGIVLITLMAYALRRVRRGPYRYVEHGIPLVTRVCSLALRPKSYYNGQPTSYEFAAILQYRDPNTQEFVAAETTSNEIGAMFKDNFTTTYRVGDYATAVYLDHDPAGTLRLYGFLELRPGLGVVKRENNSSDSPLKTGLQVAAVFCGLFLLGWTIYAYARYSPLDVTVARCAWPLAIGAVVFGGPALWLMSREAAEQRRKVEERNAQAAAEGLVVEVGADRIGMFGAHGRIGGLLIALGMMLLGGGVMLALAFTLNAALDHSPPRPKPVTITDMIMTTTNLVWRDYKIKYQFLGDQETYSIFSTPQHMDQFAINLGTAQVRDGLFGWEWVESIEPPLVLPQPGDK